jgi:GNAT superfamily N-acetyltransferase
MHVEFEGVDLLQALYHLEPFLGKAGSIFERVHQDQFQHLTQAEIPVISDAFQDFQDLLLYPDTSLDPFHLQFSIARYHGTIVPNWFSSSRGMFMKYLIEPAVPSVDEYCALRTRAGLTRRDADAAVVGLRNSLFSVVVRHDGRLIGMGRVVGDGGCHVQVVDIAVDPDYQRNGIAKAVMDEVMAFICGSIPRSCFVNLFSNVEFLYGKYGFVESKRSRGMYLDWASVRKRGTRFDHD